MRQNNNNNKKSKSLIFAFQSKGKKFQKRTKMHLPIIWIERIHLLQVYLNHFIAKQDTIFTDICLRQGTQFCAACSSIALIYYEFANLSFRRQIPWANYFITIIYYEVFLYFFSESIFPKNFWFIYFLFFFCVLA